MKLNYCAGFLGNIVSTAGSDLIHATGEAENQKQTRYVRTEYQAWRRKVIEEEKGPAAAAVRARH